MPEPFLPGQTLAAGRVEILRRPPQCSVFNASSQEALNNTTTFLAAPDQNYDTDDMHNPVITNSRITIQTPGTYQCTATVEGPAGGSGSQRLLTNFRVNGTQTVFGDARSLVSATVRASILRNIELAAGEFVEVIINQNSGSTANVKLDEFAVIRIGGSS